MKDGKSAKLQILNKINATTLEINIKVSETKEHDDINLTVDRCLIGPRDEKPENLVLIKISEDQNGRVPKKFFHGWMFSSSPALNALEHPIYDVILLNCEN